MPTATIELDPSQMAISGPGVVGIPGLTFPVDVTITGVTVKIETSGGTAFARLSEPSSPYYFPPKTVTSEDDDLLGSEQPSMVLTSQYGSLTNKSGTGYLSNWRRWDDNTEGTTQSTTGYQAQWIDNRQNGFPAIRTVVMDHLIFDTPFQVDSDEEWSFVVKIGPYTPGLYGCCLGSHNTSGTSIKSAYHWAGSRAKLRHDAGGEFNCTCNTGTSGEYFGGANSVHVLRCDGNDTVKIRVNGQFESSSTVSTGSTYHFDRISLYKTTSTQRYANVEYMELIGYEGHYLSDDEAEAIEGALCAKYNTRSILPSTHPWSSTDSKTNAEAYDTVITNSGLSITTKQSSTATTSPASLTVSSGKSQYAAGESLEMYLDDYDHNCGVVTIVVTYTED